LVRLSPWARRFVSLPADPTRQYDQLSIAAPKEATFSKLKRFQVVSPTLPRSGLEASARTLGLKATFPKSVPPEADGQSEVVYDPRGGGDLGHFGIPFQSLCPRFPVLRSGKPFYASDVPSQRRLGLGVRTGVAKLVPSVGCFGLRRPDRLLEGRWSVTRRVVIAAMEVGAA
jgi:hypothetical protein